MLTKSPTNPSFAPSENSTSNGASPPSSASSTPRILPLPSRKQSHSSDIQLPDAPVTRPMSSNSREVSDCCKPKLTRIEPEPRPQKQGGSCCSGKTKEAPLPAPPQKSCCSGKTQPTQTSMFAQASGQPTAGQNYGQFPPFQQQGLFQNQPYGMLNQGFSYNMPNNVGMSIPFGFNTPIYNHMAAGFQQPPPAQLTPTHNHTGNNGTDHNCHCGDSCNCFGCADHPSNATMMEYVRSMHHYMSTGGFGGLPAPTYDLPSYSQHPGYVTEPAQSMGFNSAPANFSHFNPSQLAFQANISATMSIPNAPTPAVTTWQQHAPVHTPAGTDPQYFSPMTAVRQTSSEVKNEEPAENSSPFADSPCESKDEDTPTLSPSAYMWQELVLPGCNDATGTCQCGDGCECVGCLTHGGHNGVPLDPPTAVEDAAFNEFMTSNDIGGNNADLMAGTFSEAPS